MVWNADNKLLLAILAGAFAIFGTLVTSIVALRNNAVSTKAALELNMKSSREARFRPFYEKQLQLSLEASRAAATLATTHDVKAFVAARARFLELYVGELAVVEQATSDFGIDSVEAKMVQFRKALDATAGDALPRSDLEGASLDLAKAVRSQTATSWDVRLGLLGEKAIDPNSRAQSQGDTR